MRKKFAMGAVPIIWRQSRIKIYENTVLLNFPYIAQSARKNK